MKKLFFKDEGTDKRGMIVGPLYVEDDSKLVKNFMGEKVPETKNYQNGMKSTIWVMVILQNGLLYNRH